jgi:hypothetical protein
MKTARRFFYLTLSLAALLAWSAAPPSADAFLGFGRGAASEKETKIEQDKGQAVIQHIRLVNTRDDLLVYFDVGNAFRPDISQAVLNGIPTSFSFYITLCRTGDSWRDKKMTDIQIRSTLKYNPLKKEFVVRRPWKEAEPLTTTSFSRARAAMTRIDNLPVASLDQLVKGGKYRLKIKAELDKVTLPLALHHLFFFVSFWDFETNWYLINFTY